MFGDQLDFLSLDDKATMNSLKSGEEVAKFMKTCRLKDRAVCMRHGCHCAISKADIAFFGAPCVDDSSMGKRSMDDGLSRRVS